MLETLSCQTAPCYRGPYRIQQQQCVRQLMQFIIYSMFQQKNPSHTLTLIRQSMHLKPNNTSQLFRLFRLIIIINISPTNSLLLARRLLARKRLGQRTESTTIISSCTTSATTAATKASMRIFGLHRSVEHGTESARRKRSSQPFVL